MSQIALFPCWWHTPWQSRVRQRRAGVPAPPRGCLQRVAASSQGCGGDTVPQTTPWAWYVTRSMNRNCSSLSGKLHVSLLRFQRCGHYFDKTAKYQNPGWGRALRCDLFLAGADFESSPQETETCFMAPAAFWCRARGPWWGEEKMVGPGAVVGRRKGRYQGKGS